MTTAGYLFLAEAADKTQLIVIAFAARLPARQVLAGVILAALLVNLLSVTVGSLLGSAFPRTPLQVAAGVLFVAVGFWTVLRRDTTGGREVHRLGPVMTVTLTIFWAELGDKSQLAAAGFAATTSAFILVWLGAAAGMVGADTLGLALGRSLQSWIPERLLRVIAGLAFVVLGGALLVEALGNLQTA